MNQERLVKLALLALKEAYKNVVKEHREKDLPMVVWKNGKITWGKPWIKKRNTGATSGLKHRS